MESAALAVRCVNAHNDLVAALRDLLAFLEPDSVADQANDVRLREERRTVEERARAALAKVDA